MPASLLRDKTTLRGLWVVATLVGSLCGYEAMATIQDYCKDRPQDHFLSPEKPGTRWSSAEYRRPFEWARAPRTSKAKAIPSPPEKLSSVEERSGENVCIGSAKTYFSPSGGCTLALVAEIGRAKKTIRFMAYNFTSDRIAEALLEAHDRGVAVSGIVDAKAAHQKGGEASKLRERGIKVYADKEHPIMHDKVMLIDSETVCFGSFNFSDNAERNSENLTIAHSPNLFASYLGHWNTHHKHSVDLVDSPPSLTLSVPYLDPKEPPEQPEELELEFPHPIQYTFPKTLPPEPADDWKPAS